ncbi:MAG: OB-fold nucleic acid binding domain-containing protein [Nitrospiraceae bacterium]|nr:OB-fold nucleic acid binding domain-containing protein [Nitrospiraceae bacterium]
MKSRVMRSTIATTGLMPLCLILIALFLPSATHAGSDVKEGYDENTEITIKGRIAGISRGERGPLILSLEASGKTYAVITSPPWYLLQEDVRFTVGQELEVTGSKYFGGDGNIYVIAARFRMLPSGKEMLLRDNDYKPLWGRGRNMKNRRG